MAFLVVAYPKIQQNDFDWIQSYRKSNDERQFSIVQPHFTLVFAVDDLPEDEFVSEVEERLEGVSSFEFVTKVATINKDDSGDYYHEFLVPDAGYSDIVKLHDKLYSGMFSPYLRLDIDFIPHIGIGSSNEALISKDRIDQLNTVGVSISGEVSSIDVIKYTGGPVVTVRKFDLVN